MDDKVITIDNPHHVQVTGIMIKKNTSVRHMDFTTNDIAYTCDVEAIQKKIDSLHDQLKHNDKLLATTLNEFPNVDEVNTVLDTFKNDSATKTMVYNLQQYL